MLYYSRTESQSDLFIKQLLYRTGRTVLSLSFILQDLLADALKMHWHFRKRNYHHESIRHVIHSTITNEKILIYLHDIRYQIVQDKHPESSAAASLWHFIAP